MKQPTASPRTPIVSGGSPMARTKSSAMPHVLEADFLRGRGVFLDRQGSQPSRYAARSSGPKRAYASSGLEVSSSTDAPCFAATSFTA
jgi:hypothetical protein